MFEKTLLDLVKGLRAHKDNPTPYVNQCLQEIKQEIKSPTKHLKSQAVQKLSHIYMLGYDISWAAFNVIEVMSHPTFGQRRVGYLCASLSFTEETDVIVLTTHLFKKAFTVTARGAEDGQQYDVGCAINCLTNIATPELAQNLLADILNMLNSSRPYVRKKTTLCLYALFQRWPKALRHSFDRLKEKLLDSDSGVQTAAVNVICELASKNPKNYINIVPILYDLLTTSGNNWMLIKLVKLMGELMPVEPRLLKKLKEPLSNIIANTPAKSLMYECINTLTQSDELPKSIVRTCLDRLKTFIEDNDQNLKYLGLLGLNKLMKSYPRAVSQYKDLIMQCIDDADVTIRMRALDLIINMVSRKNIESIIARLQEHLEETEGQYREHVLTTIIQICSQSNFDFIDDFTWYIALLVDLTRLPGVSHRNAELITAQLMDVIVRVPDVRDFGVAQMESLLLENRLIGDMQNMKQNSICNVLYAAAYVVGEFSEFVSDHIALIQGMLQKRVTSLPETVQSMFVQASLKIMCNGLSRGISNKSNALPFDEWKVYAGQCFDVVVNGLECFTISNLLEVQERAVAYLQLARWLQAQLGQGQEMVVNIMQALESTFKTDLNPVHPNAQKKVKVPKGVDLDEWIHTPPPSDVEFSDDDDYGGRDDHSSSRDSSSDHSDDAASDSSEEDTKSRKKKKKRKHKNKHANDAYYIKGDLRPESSVSDDGVDEEDIRRIPVKKLSKSYFGGVPLKVSAKRKRRKRPDVVMGFVGQEAVSDDEKAKPKEEDDASDDLGNIDLTKKHDTDDDDIPQLKPYTRLDPAEEREKLRKERKRRKKQKEEREHSQSGDGDENRDNHKKKKRRRDRDDRGRSRRDRKHRKHRKKQKDDDGDPVDPGGSLANATSDLLNLGVSSPRPGAPLGARSKSNGTSSSAPLDFLGFGSPAQPVPASNGANGISKRKAPRSNSAPPESADADSYGSRQTLCSNSHITVTYVAVPDDSSSKPTINVTFEAHAKTTVKGLKLQLKSSEFLRLSDKASTVRLGARLKSGQSETSEVSVRCKRIVSESLSGKLSYHVKDSKKSIDNLDVRINSSHFVRVQDSMTLDGLRDVLSDGKSCRKERSVRVKPPDHLSRSEMLEAIGAVLGCQVVDQQDKTATYYGELLFGKHVAALAKIRSNGEVSIDVKSADSQICEAFVEIIEERLK